MNQPPLSNINIIAQKRLFSPAELTRQFPVTERGRESILRARSTLRAILERRDSRKMVIVGPCSIHDIDAALDYARRLHKLAQEVEDVFFIVMRVYFEKPRTTVGWKGLINDPDLNGTFDIEKGLRLARKLMIDISDLGLPIGTEALDPIMPQYIGDLVSWTAIGARTAESQTHREMSSGLSTPVGFKNGTDGSLEVAINAIESASRPHSFLGVDAEGYTAITRSRGNAYGHIVLRGGNRGPNYDSVNVAICTETLRKKGIAPTLVIDCSHANSNKDHTRQPLVFQNCVHQILEGSDAIVGMMLESHIHAGNQKLGEDLSALRYGVSITDACIDFATTESLLRHTAEQLRLRRNA